MRRVSVVGSPGSGKTTVGVELARRLDLPHIELDAIYHQPGWVPTPRDEFRAALRALVAGRPGWVIDGNYGSKARDIVWTAADTVVWLDLPKMRVMTSVIGRTLVRVFGRRVLWNENRERLRNLFSRDPLENLLLWTWTQFDSYRATYAQASNDPALSHLTFVRLCSRREIRSWLNSVGGRSATSEPDTGND